MEQLWEMDDHVVSLSALWNPGVLQIIPSSLQSNRSCGLSHLYYGVQLTTEAGCHRIAMLGELNREVYQIVIKWIIFLSLYYTVYYIFSSILHSIRVPLVVFLLAGPPPVVSCGCERLC